MVIESRLLTEGWKSVGIAKFKRMASAVEVKDTNVIINYASQWKVSIRNYLYTYIIICGVRDGPHRLMQ